MEAQSSFVNYVYLASAVLFILALQWMGQVKTARRGNWAGTAAMVLAGGGTIIAGRFSTEGYTWIAIALVIGSAIGVPMALVMPMTAVPQRTALSHAFGGLAAALVGFAEYHENTPNIAKFTAFALALEMLLGFLTFTGSLMAFGKLQEIVTTRPVVYPGRNFVSIGTLATAVISAIWLTVDPGAMPALIVLIVASLLFGVLLIIPIGGA